MGCEVIVGVLVSFEQCKYFHEIVVKLELQDFKDKFQCFPLLLLLTKNKQNLSLLGVAFNTQRQKKQDLPIFYKA
jgi:hypothetical protein